MGDVGIDPMLDLLRAAGPNPCDVIGGEVAWVDCSVVWRAHGGRYSAEQRAFTEDGREAYRAGTEPGAFACVHNPAGF